MKYYKMKKNMYSSQDLTYYIMNVILKEQLIHDEYIQPMWAIFEYEMLELLKVSRKNYGEYLKFRDYQEKICKYV